MKILEINKYFYIKRGAEKHFFDVVDLLGANNEVAVFSMKHRNNLSSKWEKYFLSTVGFTQEYSWKQKIKGSFRDLYSIEAKKKINRLLDDFKPDVVHIHNIYHQLSPMILFEIKKRNIPIVMTVHDYKLVNPNYNLFHNGKFYDRCLNGKYYQCFFDKCFKNSYLQSFLAMLEMYWHEFFGTYKKNIDLYIVPSNFVKNILVERGIDERKIEILPHFVKSDKKNIEDIENGEKYVLCIGEVSKSKGTDELINLFKSIEGANLYLAGSVKNDFEILSGNNIKYLGHLQEEELKKYIKNSLCVISGSKLPETFGLVALEAISLGKPFIGFESGAYAEIIQNGKNGFLVKNRREMKEIIVNILDNKGLFNENSIRQEAIKKYNEENYRKSIENIFLKLVSGNIDKN